MPIALEEENDGSGSEAGNVIHERGLGCLPVAHLDDSFTGEPTNGAEYLAMIQKEAASLPFTTKMDLPGTIAETNTQHDDREVEQGSTLTRHPALPKESWYVAFDGHFRSYRKFIRTSRPTLQARYKETIAQSSASKRPLPNSRSETQWATFINGARRKKMHKTSVQSDGDGSKTCPTEDGAPDEEEIANNAPISTGIFEDTCSSLIESASADDVESDSPFVWEPQQPKHLPQEPYLPMLATLSQDHIYVALRSLNDQIFARIRALDGPNLLMETQPGSSNDVSPRAMALPLPAHQARWIFSLLLFLDDYLPPSDLADLRGIAKTCLRIVRWQVTSHTYVSADAQKDQSEQEDMRTSCWIIHRAISTGWAQNDLPRDAEAIFARIQKNQLQ
ncbi:hypothetical protein FFLO_04260 [Filobasidium floriforme]|uniref:Uncharacterized protein n=1 Tax=Filobasidium floriforme TaxID=5210 RepID=A0A8K0NQ19_9TREE|nr:hypothetical protein FFLO_04260 [Filobasidium floriforme]